MMEPKAANVGGGGGWGGMGGGASNLFRGQLIQFASRLFSVLCQQECSPKSDYLLANKDQVKSKKEPSSCKFSQRLSGSRRPAFVFSLSAYRPLR